MSHAHPHRLRRLRRSPFMRSLMAESGFVPSTRLIPAINIAKAPSPYLYTLEEACNKTKQWANEGVLGFLVGALSSLPSESGNPSLAEAIGALKPLHPHGVCMAYVAFCHYSPSHHCTVVAPHNQHLLNEPTLESLAKTTVEAAKAGADLIVLGCMIDQVVLRCRAALDEAGFLYMPLFSQITYNSIWNQLSDGHLGITPAFGSRATYNLDVQNGIEALKEAQLDHQEGVDGYVLSPALWSLDVLYRLSLLKKPLWAHISPAEWAFCHTKALQEEAFCVLRRAGASAILVPQTKA